MSARAEMGPSEWAHCVTSYTVEMCLGAQPLCVLGKMTWRLRTGLAAVFGAGAGLGEWHVDSLRAGRPGSYSVWPERVLWWVWPREVEPEPSGL